MREKNLVGEVGKSDIFPLRLFSSDGKSEWAQLGWRQAQNMIKKVSTFPHKKRQEEKTLPVCLSVCPIFGTSQLHNMTVPDWDVRKPPTQYGFTAIIPGGQGR